MPRHLSSSAQPRAVELIIGIWYVFQRLFTIFGRPFVKRLALCYRPLSVCLPVLSVSPVLSVLSVCNVGVLWSNAWMDQNETWHAGRPRPGHFVLDGARLPVPKGAQPPPCSAHIRAVGGAAGSASVTVWPGPRSTSVQSGILIHPAVWPQRTSAENWGLCPFRGGELGRSPSITMSPGSIMMHPAV